MSAPAPVLTPTTAAHLAADLAALPYTTAAVEELLGPMALQALDREHAEPARAVIAGILADPDPQVPRHRLAGVVSVWLLGDAVPAALLDAALPRLGVTGALAARLVGPAAADGGDEAAADDEARQPATVRGLVDLSAYETDSPGPLWVASDQTALQRRGPLPADHVLGIGRASLTLAGAVDRSPADTALDLGTGCGIQTLHLLAHVRHVTATDLSPRCLAFTRFNLLLNAEVLGLDRAHLEERVELLAGDLLEPVAGRTFERIVTNPPFVITPRGDAAAPVLTYRDGGREGDRLVAELIQRAPEHLQPGGTLTMLANWEIHAHGDSMARVREWIGTQAAAWLIQRDRQDPAGYAETWLQDSSLELDPGQYQRRYTDYLEDFAARGVAAVGFGYLWLRRPLAGQPVWHVTEEITQPIDASIGPAWAAGVRRRDRVAAPQARDGAPWEQLHLRVAPDVTEERHARFGAEHPEVILARQGSGFRRVARLDTATAGVLSAADGELSIAQLVGAVVALLELDDAGAHALGAAVRGLFEDGFLVEA
ncbi:MAG: methyltransferase [Micrococcus sp.]|nr:methyltransferase [Micrococcus sp.]